MALTSLAGCSFALSGPDANRPKNRAPECDTGKGLVGLDGVVGSVFATSALVALSEDEQSVAAVTGLLAAAYVAGAIKGNTTVNECRSALAAYNTQTYEPGPDEPQVGRLRPRQPSRPVAAEPGPAPLPPEYAQPEGPAARPPVAPTTATPPSAPPVAVAPPPAPNKPPWKDPKGAPKRPAPVADAPADWRDFWTEVP